MPTVSKTVLNIPIETLSGIDTMFGRKMKMDTTNVPKKFKQAFDATRRVAFTQLNVTGICESYEIDHFTDSQIWLKNGNVLDSNMYAKMFSGSTELVFCVVSVSGYEALDDAEDNMLAKLFLDSWGSSIAGSAYYWLQKSIVKTLEEQGIYSTSSFSPGQHGVPMELQKIIFGELKPEEIGVTLNDHFLMQPKKSISGVFGIGTEKIDENLRPCDFCGLRKTCPSAYSEDCYSADNM